MHGLKPERTKQMTAGRLPVGSGAGGLSAMRPMMQRVFYLGIYNSFQCLPAHGSPHKSRVRGMVGDLLPGGLPMIILPLGHKGKGRRPTRGFSSSLITCLAGVPGVVGGAPHIVRRQPEFACRQNLNKVLRSRSGRECRGRTRKSVNCREWNGKWMSDSFRDWRYAHHHGKVECQDPGCFMLHLNNTLAAVCEFISAAHLPSPPQ